MDLFLEAHATPPEEIIPAMDATDDPLHGSQEGRFFHGHHGHYCYLPLYVTCGEHVPCSRLHPLDIDASHGTVDEFMRIVPQIRAAWPKTRILVRGDSGFCREEIMAWRKGPVMRYAAATAIRTSGTARVAVTAGLRPGWAGMAGFSGARTGPHARSPGTRGAKLHGRPLNVDEKEKTAEAVFLPSGHLHTRRGGGNPKIPQV